MNREDSDAAAVLIWGVHPVTESVTKRPGEVERVWVERGRDRPLGRLLRIARQSGIPVSYVTRDVFRRRVGAARANQGIAAEVAPLAYADPAQVVAAASARELGWLVALDGVSDPRNVGAVLRTCAGAGVDGVLLSSEGTAGLTAAAIKASAGAAGRVPVARDPRLSQRLEELAASGFLVVGLAPRGADSWDSVDLAGRIVLVAGGEHKGLRPGIDRVLGRRVAIPMAGGVESLNVGVALGVLLFEAVRQRRGIPGTLDATRGRC